MLAFIEQKNYSMPRSGIARVIDYVTFTKINRGRLL